MSNDTAVAYLRVRRLDTRELVCSVGVKNVSEHYVERVMSGMLRNMAEDYYIDDSEVDAARAAIAKAEKA